MIPAFVDCRMILANVMLREETTLKHALRQWQDSGGISNEFCLTIHQKSYFSM